MSARPYILDPNSPGMDFYVDWSRWLGDRVIVTSTWILPDELEQVDANNTTTVAGVILKAANGVTRGTFEVVSRITYLGGGNDQTIRIKVLQR